MAKAQFGPVPLRAISDAHLSSLEVRLLAAIGYHDRLSTSRGKGAGCWAGNNTLAKECGCRLDSLSAAATRLVQRGYVTREPHPLNKRLRVYRVNYGSDDRAPAQSNDRAPAQSFEPETPEGCTDVSTLGQMPNELPAMLGQTKQQPTEDDRNSDVEYIPHKREEILPKQERYSPKGAPPLRIGGTAVRQSCRNPGATLTMIERALGDGGNWDRSTEQAVQKIFDESEGNSPIQHQATRILETWGSANAA